jgi:hypothetical protein
MLLGGSRRGRWPILARAPGEDGPNSDKDNPQGPRPGGRRANPPAPGRWAPGGHQRPEELPRPSRVSLERVSSYDPKAAEPHRRNGGWRPPPPSGSPSGPVGPSGRNSNPDFPVQPRRPLGAQRNLEGGRGRVKATFPLAKRVCPASSRSNYLDGISDDEPSLGPSPSGYPPGHWHRHRSHGTHVRGLVPGAPLQAASRLRPQGAPQPAPTRTPVPPDGLSRHASRVIAAGTAGAALPPGSAFQLVPGAWLPAMARSDQGHAGGPGRRPARWPPAAPGTRRT